GDTSRNARDRPRPVSSSPRPIGREYGPPPVAGSSLGPCRAPLFPRPDLHAALETCVFVVRRARAGEPRQSPWARHLHRESLEPPRLLGTLRRAPPPRPWKGRIRRRRRSLLRQGAQGDEEARVVVLVDVEHVPDEARWRSSITGACRMVDRQGNVDRDISRRWSIEPRKAGPLSRWARLARNNEGHSRGSALSRRASPRTAEGDERDHAGAGRGAHR